MTAKEDDSRLCYKIISNQRNTRSSNTKELVLNNYLYTNNLLTAWDNHFTRLATPALAENFETERQEQAHNNVSLISALERDSSLPIKITRQEVIQIISSFKNRKAKDTFDLVAENLKLAPEVIADFLTPVINNIILTGKIPDQLKEGLVHPIHKKGKPKQDPGNYRGITITPVIMKIIDTIILQHQHLATPSRLHRMQFGFTSGKNGLQAAFILMESIAEAKDNGETLFCASLDVQKAFDVVRHSSLLDKLYERGIWWKLKEDSYRGLKSRVFWNGEKSKSSHQVLQGNGQGKVPSPDDYLIYQCDILETVDKALTGYHIGSIPITTTTCADDMLILDTDPYSLQATLSMVTDYANEEHYVLHPTKSVVIPFNFKSKTELNHLKENIEIEINGNELPIVEELVHLGLTHNRNSSVLPTIENRISTANRTLYVLMGPGLHGTNGLPPEISLHLYNVYVIPRALYGLEVLTLTDTILKSMELFHRKSLRSLLGLPERTATAGLYILTGSLPIKFYVHTSTLGFLWTLLNTEVTREIILRQYATKSSSSASWVVYSSKLLSKYNLPSIIDIYIDFPDKEQWRKSVQKATSRDSRNTRGGKDQKYPDTTKHSIPTKTNTQCHLLHYQSVPSQSYEHQDTSFIRCLSTRQ